MSKTTTVVRTAAIILGSGLIAATLAPAAGASTNLDFTDGGRIASGLSNVELPDGLSAGSIGGQELSQVDQLDPERYSGRWYQVAAIPQPFSLQCYSDTTADYGVLDNSTISVTNSCSTVWGGESSISGSAKIQDPNQPASLRVAFDDTPGQSLDGSVNYRVTYLDDDYSLAVVGDPDRLSGFVLSRTPSISAEQWQNINSVVTDRGWWSCAFLTTPQTDGRQDITPLCQV